MNVRHLYFNQMGDLILFPMKVHTNESSMANILYFAEAANIKGVYINTETSKEKLINVHIKYRKIIHFKACVEGIFCTNLDDHIMITNPTNVSLNAYYYLSMVKKGNFY